MSDEICVSNFVYTYILKLALISWKVPWEGIFQREIYLWEQKVLKWKEINYLKWATNGKILQAFVIKCSQNKLFTFSILIYIVMGFFLKTTLLSSSLVSFI